MGLKYGIDLSAYQSGLDWNLLLGYHPETKFAIIRTGYSYGEKYMDSKFVDHVLNARAHNIDVYGVYHFSYALSIEDAKQEAAWCVRMLERAELPKSTIVFFDFEYGSEDFCKRHNVACDTNFIRSVTEAFCEEIRKAGYAPGVYLNVDYHNRMYKNWFPKDVKVWGAKWINYNGGSTVTPVDDETLSLIDKQPPFVFDVWQYGAIKIPSYGVVDADVMFVPDEVKMESRKSNEEIAAEVVRGEWGNGAERRYRLEAEGYDYRAVQNIVNTYYE